jgi:xanthine dehydrogenase small subunit
VACVTPARRLQGREITTLDGLPEAERERWTEAFVATGASQCGFCTPGIVMRLAALAHDAPSTEQIDRSLLAHLCRCTGWQSIEEAARLARGDSADPVVGSPEPPVHRDLERASRRAALEGGVPQEVGPSAVLGRAGFADDTCPADALVAVPDGAGGYALAETVREARASAGKVQGRRTSLALEHPVELPPGPWDLTLQTTWVEPAYVEPDASWCVPGGEPASPVANGGAFGGKRRSPVTGDARRLADGNGRPVRVLWSREDVVRSGPKRPPVAGGVSADGTGILRFGVPPDGLPADDWSSLSAAVARVAPGLALEPVPLHGPPISLDLRASVWAEAAVLVTCARIRASAPLSESTTSSESIRAVPRGDHRSGWGAGRGALPGRRHHRGGGRRR